MNDRENNLITSDCSKLLEKAIAIAVDAHAGQIDKAGEPYILHPLRVMHNCKDVKAKIVAVLHDTVNYTDVTPEFLKSEEFPEVILKALDCLTYRKDESGDDYMCRIIPNPIACEVKREDLRDNMDLSRLPAITDDDRARHEYYCKIFGFITIACRAYNV